MKKEKEKLPKLTHRQKIFVKEYLKEENGRKAAEKAYNINTKHGTNDPGRVAYSIATENLSKPAIIKAIESQQLSLREALLKEGITPEYLAKKVDVLLTAKNDNNKPDYTAIDKGLKHATNIYGIQDLDKPKEGNTYNFVFNNEIQSEIIEIESRIKEKLRNPNEDNK